jgi:adenine deaminase
MNVVGPFLRERKEEILEVKNNVVIPDIEKDVAMCSVIERFGKNGNKSLAFCSGWKLKSGAMASSAAPDDNNIIVIGTNSSDMAFAVNYLINNKGGQVVVKDGKVLSFLSLPVGGICSDEEPIIVANKEKELTKAANLLGCNLPEPLMYMFFLPITCLPDYALTDLGPIDTQKLCVFNPILSLE